MLSQDVISADAGEKEKILNKAIQDTFNLKVPNRKRQASDSPSSDASGESDDGAPQQEIGNDSNNMRDTRNSRRASVTQPIKQPKKKKADIGAFSSKNV